MGIDFSTLVYEPCQDVFGRSVTFYPDVSQPAGASYPARGIYDSRTLNVVAEDGSIFSDQDTILDIRDAEFAVMPVQDDRVYIGPDNPPSAMPTLGMYQITSVWNNGGGETTLQLRKIVP